MALKTRSQCLFAVGQRLVGGVTPSFCTQVLLRGKKEGEGILCDCCKKVVRPLVLAHSIAWFWSLSIQVPLTSLTYTQSSPQPLMYQLLVRQGGGENVPQANSSTSHQEIFYDVFLPAGHVHRVREACGPFNVSKPVSNSNNVSKTFWSRFLIGMSQQASTKYHYIHSATKAV